MNIRQLPLLGGVVLAVVLSLWVSPKDTVLAKPPQLDVLNPHQTVSPALVGRMHGVTMLEFIADRAIREIRVVENERIAGSLNVAVADNQTKLKLAAVVSEQRKSISVFIDTGNYSREIITAYSPLQDARDAPPKESIGPVKDLKLAESEWTEVYRLSATRYAGKDVVNFELKIEIR